MLSAEMTGPQTAALRPWLSIVGIGEEGIEGLSSAARELVRSAAVVFGGPRHLALAASLIRGVARPWAVPFDQSLAEVRQLRGHPVCVLASGDPFFHGVGSLLSHQVRGDEMVSVPARSVFSLAASRLFWSIPQTVLLSLCGRPLDLIRPHLHPGARILVLTSDQCTPHGIARLLAGSGFGPSQVTVLEALVGARGNAFEPRVPIDSILRTSMRSTPWPSKVAAEPNARILPRAARPRGRACSSTTDK